ncbi:MAG: DUF3108 domain-containing protein [Bacteroidetes bacterium]|nr:DUF3108 domain-containing protein [Bacteroidota bacterium]
MYLKKHCLSILLLLIIPLSALNAQCFKENHVFQEGEYISYTVSYSWGPVWVDAGLVTFSIDKENYQGKPSWHLKSSGKTFKTYDFFFKVNDYYDSWINPETFHAYAFRRSVYEGGYTLLNTMQFDPSRQIIYSTTKTNNNPVRYDTLKQRYCAYDPLSAVYVTRTMDISNLKPDMRIPVTVILDDKTYEIYIKYLGKEIVQNRDEKKYRCIKFAAKMVEGTIFRGDEDVVVWVTDDDNRIPVYIEAKILVGTVKAYLKEMKGLRNPVTSIVK